MEEINKQIAKKLKNYLSSQGIQHKDFAEKIGVTPSYFGNYITGKRDIQNIFILLHTKANIDLNWLVSGKGYPIIEEKGFYIDFEKSPNQMNLEQLLNFETMRRKMNILHASLPLEAMQFLKMVDETTGTFLNEV